MLHADPASNLIKDLRRTFIVGIVAKGEESFIANVQGQRAAEMVLIRPGEGVAKIPEPVRERFADQPWRHLIILRNFAAHQYDDIDPRRVWRTLTRDVPRLREYLAEVVLPGLWPLRMKFRHT